MKRNTSFLFTVTYLLMTFLITGAEAGRHGKPPHSIVTILMPTTTWK